MVKFRHKLKGGWTGIVAGHSILFVKNIARRMLNIFVALTCLLANAARVSAETPEALADHLIGNPTFYHDESARNKDKQTARLLIGNWTATNGIVTLQFRKDGAFLRVATSNQVPAVSGQVAEEMLLSSRAVLEGEWKVFDGTLELSRAALKSLGSPVYFIDKVDEVNLRFSTNPKRSMAVFTRDKADSADAKPAGDSQIISTRSGRTFTVAQMLELKDTIDGGQVTARDFIASFDGRVTGFAMDGNKYNGRLHIAFRGFTDHLLVLPEVVGMVDGLVMDQFSLEFEPPWQGGSNVCPVVERALFGFPNGFQCFIQFRLAANDRQSYGMYGILTPHRLSGELMRFGEDGHPRPNGFWSSTSSKSPVKAGQVDLKTETVAETNVAITNTTARAFHFQAIKTLCDPQATREAYQQALDLLKKANQLEPDNYEILTDMGRILLKFSDYVEAERILKHVVERYPGFAEPRAGLANVYLKVGDLTKAQAICAEGLEKFPSSQEIVAIYVGVLEKQHDWTGIYNVVSNFLKTAQLPSQQRIRYVWVLGKAALSNGDYEHAKENLQKVVTEAAGTPLGDQAKRALTEVERHMSGGAF